MSRTKFSGQHVMTLCFALISIGVIVQSLKWPFRTALFPVIIGGCALHALAGGVLDESL